MPIVLSQQIRDKLSKKTPPVGERDILECFANRTGTFLTDTREKNATTPATRWFVSETNYGTVLKVCFIPMPNGDIVIKTAYVPNSEEVRIYNKFGVPS